MSNKNALAKLLNPESIAVFGGDDAAEVIVQCRNAGFDGDLWAVNPKRPELAGVPCVRSVAELPGPPDASFVAAPPEASVSIIRDLAGVGARGAVCFAAGFAEAGAEGAKLQQELQALDGEIAIVGPNCHGFLNYLDGVALWPDQHGGRRVERGVALILQSGNIGINVTMQQRGLDVGYVISTGNQSNLGIHDYIEILLDDPRVSAIGLHIEGIRDVPAFSETAIAALRKGIPIVAIKTGRSARGAEIAIGHTGSLAGTDGLYSALFERVGIARCTTLAGFIESLKFLSVTGVLAGSSLGSMSCSGGEASIIADCAESLGLETPQPGDASVRDLRDVLGPNVHVSNPLDYHTYAWGDYHKLNDCFRAMLANRFDCTILALDYPVNGGSARNWETAERAFVDAANASGQRAAVVSCLPETLPAAARDRLAAAGIAPMQGLEDCLDAIRGAAAIGEAQRRADSIAPINGVEAVSGPAVSLDEWESKQALAEFGLRVPAGRPCTATEAETAADELGYPVVVKGLSNEVAHKTDVGAVALDLSDGDAVRAAVKSMGRRFDRFLVEEMVGPAVAEILVGVSRDPAFGLTLLIGAGGTDVETLDDVASLLFPVARDEIRAALRSLRISRIIEKPRGSVPGDLDAISDAAGAVANYALANNSTLIELDVNPLVVMANGAVAADAFIRKVAGSG